MDSTNTSSVSDSELEEARKTQNAPDSLDAFDLFMTQKIYEELVNYVCQKAETQDKACQTDN